MRQFRIPTNLLTVCNRQTNREIFTFRIMVLIWEYQLLLSILQKVFKTAFIKTGYFTSIFHLKIFTLKYFACQKFQLFVNGLYITIKVQKVRIICNVMYFIILNCFI